MLESGAMVEQFCINEHITVGTTSKRRSYRSKIEGGLLFAHRATGTTCAAHSLELKIKASLK